MQLLFFLNKTSKTLNSQHIHVSNANTKIDLIDNCQFLDISYKTPFAHSGSNMYVASNMSPKLIWKYLAVTIGKLVNFHSSNY